jgi:hypothetical protein
MGMTFVLLVLHEVIPGLLKLVTERHEFWFVSLLNTWCSMLDASHFVILLCTTYFLFFHVLCSFFLRLLNPKVSRAASEEG